MKFRHVIVIFFLNARIFDVQVEEDGNLKPIFLHAFIYIFSRWNFVLFKNAFFLLIKFETITTTTKTTKNYK
jgi:hypothetical protein